MRSLNILFAKKKNFAHMFCLHLSNLFSRFSHTKMCTQIYCQNRGQSVTVTRVAFICHVMYYITLTTTFLKRYLGKQASDTFSQKHFV